MNKVLLYGAGRILTFWERETRFEPATSQHLFWSGTRESNSRLDLGKIVYYHYTSPA